MLRKREMITLEAFASRVRLPVEEVVKQAEKEHGSLENWAAYSQVNTGSIREWMKKFSMNESPIAQMKSIKQISVISIDLAKSAGIPIMPIDNTQVWSEAAIEAINDIPSKTVDIEQALIDMGAKPARKRKSSSDKTLTSQEVMYKKCNADETTPVQEENDKNGNDNQDSGTDRTITGITCEGGNPLTGEEQHTTP